MSENAYSRREVLGALGITAGSSIAGCLEPDQTETERRQEKCGFETTKSNGEAYGVNRLNTDYKVSVSVNDDQTIDLTVVEKTLDDEKDVVVSFEYNVENVEQGEIAEPDEELHIWYKDTTSEGEVVLCNGDEYL